VLGGAGAWSCRTGSQWASGFPAFGKRALPALSLASDSAMLTGVAAAQGPDAIFSHELLTLGRRGDIAMGLTGGEDDLAVRRGLAADHSSRPGTEYRREHRSRDLSHPRLRAVDPATAGRRCHVSGKAVRPQHDHADRLQQELQHDTNHRQRRNHIRQREEAEGNRHPAQRQQ